MIMYICQKPCPFYGCHLAISREVKVMVHSAVPSNQCALVTDAHSQCYMEINGSAPDFRSCPRTRNLDLIIQKLKEISVISEKGVELSMEDWVSKFIDNGPERPEG